MFLLHRFEFPLPYLGDHLCAVAKVCWYVRPGGWGGSGECRACFPEVSPEAMRLVLHYIYTGDLGSCEGEGSFNPVL